MTATRDPATSASIALLNQGGELGAELREALRALGASIVYEAPASGLDLFALKASGARVVVVNLGGDSDEEIDEIHELLDAADYEIVINDTETSVQLSSTDQARWARHLAAKILRRPEVTLPPVPEGAQAVPTLAQRWAEQVPVAETPGLPPASEVVVPAAATPSAETSLPSSERTTVELPLPPELREVAQAQAETSAGVRVDTGFALALESFEAAAKSMHAPAEDLQDFDALFLDTPAAAPEQPAETDEVVESSAVHVTSVTVAEPAEANSIAAPDWSLAPVIEGDAATAPESGLPSEPKPAASEFGIETIPAHVYLAPQVDPEPPRSADTPAPGIDISGLELVPIESEVPVVSNTVAYDTGKELQPHTKVRSKRARDESDQPKKD